MSCNEVSWWHVVDVMYCLNVLSRTWWRSIRRNLISSSIEPRRAWTWTVHESREWGLHSWLELQFECHNACRNRLHDINLLSSKSYRYFYQLLPLANGQMTIYDAYNHSLWHWIGRPKTGQVPACVHHVSLYHVTNIRILIGESYCCFLPFINDLSWPGPGLQAWLDHKRLSMA